MFELPHLKEYLFLLLPVQKENISFKRWVATINAFEGSKKNVDIYIGKRLLMQINNDAVSIGKKKYYYGYEADDWSGDIGYDHWMGALEKTFIKIIHANPDNITIIERKEE